jgi:hypothetical protein
MDAKRIVLNCVIPVFVLSVRCLLVFGAHRIWPTLCGKRTARLDFAKAVATLGWDFASVGLGFFVSALLNADSWLVLVERQQDVGAQNLVTVTSAGLFMAVYGPAVFVRFCLLEAWADLETIHKFAYGLASIVLGALLMVTTSKLAIRPTPAPSRVLHYETTPSNKQWKHNA